MEPSFQHKQFMAANVKVFFPFEPYQTQREFATAVVDSLNSSHNAILESPTGTGKTLSLLCSTLAWLQAQNGTVKCMVYYTSRTHIQLAQAAKELKRTAYARIPSIVIGSRAQMCLNHEVKSQGSDHQLNRACRNAIAKNACSYYTNYESKLEKMDSDLCLDIEDMMDHGRRTQMCPYYASKKLAESKSTVVFMPYNYLLDPTLRKGNQLRLENSIVIFDEAHNIDGVLKDAVSGNFSQSCLKTVQDCCRNLPEKVTEALNYESHGLSRYGYDPSKKANKDSGDAAKNSKKSSKKQNEPEKVNPIEELASKLTGERLQQISQCAGSLLRQIPEQCEIGKTKSIERLLHELKVTGIHYATSSPIIETLESMSSFYSIAGVMSPSIVAKSVAAISNLCNFITLIFPDRCANQNRLEEHEQKLKKFYVSYMEGEYEQTASNLWQRGSTNMNNGKLKDWTLYLWCLHPAIGMKRIIDEHCIRGPRSIIITSGTLAPLQWIEKELEVKFEVKREFSHIIKLDQLKIFAFEKSPNGYSLLSTYDAAKKDDYKLNLGKTLHPLIKVLPFGTLIFFPSYGAMDKAIKFWRDKSNIWREMQSAASLFIEAKTQDSFLNDIRQFKERVNEKRKAVYFCVCRGKLSEGVNLEGNHCRTVIMTGLPFPSIGDVRVQETKNFNMQKRNDTKWYERQMTRALNQTLGRVIRNKDDFGLLILCGPGFTRYKLTLSEWTRPYFPSVPTKFDEVEKELKDFFKLHDIDITETVSENHGAFEIGFSSTPLSNPQSLTSSQASLTRGFVAFQQQLPSHIPRLSQPEQQSQNQQLSQTNSGPIRGRVADFIAPFAIKRKREIEEEEEERRKALEQPVIVDQKDRLDDIFGSEDLPGPRPSATPRPNPAPRPVPIFRPIAARSAGLKTNNNTNGVSANHNTNGLRPPIPPIINIPPIEARMITQSTTGQHNLEYSILQQNLLNKHKPPKYKCYICKSENAKSPVRLNCECARVACKSCSASLNNKTCGDCKVKYKKKRFKTLNHCDNKL